MHNISSVRIPIEQETLDRVCDRIHDLMRRDPLIENTLQGIVNWHLARDEHWESRNREEQLRFEADLVGDAVVALLGRVIATTVSLL